MQAQNAAEIRRLRLAGLSWRSPPSALTTTLAAAGDAEAATSGLSTMTPADDAPPAPPPPPLWRISERDTTRGEGSPARTLAS